MITIKVSDELAAKLGAKTSEEILAALESLPKAKEDAKTFADKFDLLVKRLDGMEGKLTEVAAREIPKIDVAEILSKAEAKATSAAQAHVQKVAANFGGKPIGNEETPADVTKENASNADDGDYKAQWKKSKNIQAEFPSAEHYETFMTMQKAGRILIHKGK